MKMFETYYVVMCEEFNDNKDDAGFGSHFVFPAHIFGTADKANAYIMDMAIKQWETGGDGTEYVDWKFWCGVNGDMTCGNIVLTDKNNQWVKFWTEKAPFD